MLKSIEKERKENMKIKQVFSTKEFQQLNDILLSEP